MVIRRRPHLAPFLLSLLTVASVIAPACRWGYEELDRSHSELDGGAASSEAGQAANGATSPIGGDSFDSGGAPGSDAGAPPGVGGFNMGGTVFGGGNGGMPVVNEGGGPSAPPCTSTAECTCDELDGHSYWFCTQHLYWNDANAHCQTNGMTLVQVDRATENDFLLVAGSAHGVFAFNNFAQIGASDQAVAGEWRWPDGTLFWQGGSNGMLVKGTYANWDGQSPSASGAQSCSGVLSSGLWQDRSCTGAEPFICESP